jgi:TPR repeat protein
MSKKSHLFISICFLCATIYINQALAQQNPTESANDFIVDKILNDAEAHENKNTLNHQWEAAKLYCKASRLGVIEAQYRLGVLYAFGKGVPKNRDYAATLFAISSQQGHQEATEMLEAIHYTSDVAPPCVTQAVDPEKISYKSARDSQMGDIDQYLARLPKQQKWVIDLVNTTSEWYQVDPKLILSIIAIESGFNKMATSNANAMGLMQLIPATADRFNVKNAYDAVQNIKGGTRYLSWLLNYYSGDVTLVVAAYNAGEKAVDRYKGVPPYKETMQYVKKFKKLYAPEQHPYRERQ